MHAALGLDGGEKVADGMLTEQIMAVGGVENNIASLGGKRGKTMRA